MGEQPSAEPELDPALQFSWMRAQVAEARPKEGTAYHIDGLTVGRARSRKGFCHRPVWGADRTESRTFRWDPDAEEGVKFPLPGHCEPPAIRSGGLALLTRRSNDVAQSELDNTSRLCTCAPRAFVPPTLNSYQHY